MVSSVSEIDLQVRLSTLISHPDQTSRSIWTLFTRRSSSGSLSATSHSPKSNPKSPLGSLATSALLLILEGRIIKADALKNRIVVAPEVQRQRFKNYLQVGTLFTLSIKWCLMSIVVPEYTQSHACCVGYMDIQQSNRLSCDCRNIYYEGVEDGLGSPRLC